MRPKKAIVADCPDCGQTYIIIIPTPCGKLYLNITCDKCGRKFQYPS